MSYYYVVETQYVGPGKDDDKYIDTRTVDIRREPPRTNVSHEVCAAGWCGTTNGWRVDAHGAYDDLNAAIQVVRDKFGPSRHADRNGTDYRYFSRDQDNVIIAYKPGMLYPMGLKRSIEWVKGIYTSTIFADTSDEDLDRHVGNMHWAARSEGFSLHDGLKDFVINYRQDLRDEAELERQQNGDRRSWFQRFMES